MTSDRGYPNSTGDTFGPVLDHYRCAAAHVGRRCQLYDSHDDPHAHAWLEPGRTWRPRIYRWTDTGEQWEHDQRVRLQRCCLSRH
jgi:hypothetical protein